MLRYSWIQKENREKHQQALRELCRNSVMSSQGRRFYLDHGDDYFAFFDALGEGVFLGAFDGDKLVAISAAVLRKGSRRGKDQEIPFWQICDFRVLPGYSHEKLGKEMFLRATAKQWIRARRGCALVLQPFETTNSGAMPANDSSKESPDESFVVFSLNGEEYERAIPMLQQHGFGWRLVSLHNSRRMVFLEGPPQSEVLHLHFVPEAIEMNLNVDRDKIYVFCLSSRSEAVVSLKRSGLGPDGRVVVHQRRMKNWDWSWVNSSDL